MNQTGRPAQHENVFEQELDDETVLYDSRDDSTHILNLTAAMVWELCDGQNDVDEIAAEVANRFELSPEKVEPDVRRILGQFTAARLVHWR